MCAFNTLLVYQESDPLCCLLADGKNKLTHTLTQNADGSISNKMNLPEEKVYTWIVDGEQHIDETGQAYICSWEGDKLVLLPGADSPPTQFALMRFMDGHLSTVNCHFVPPLR